MMFMYIYVLKTINDERGHEFNRASGSMWESLEEGKGRGE